MLLSRSAKAGAHFDSGENGCGNDDPPIFQMCSLRFGGRFFALGRTELFCVDKSSHWMKQGGTHVHDDFGKDEMSQVRGGD